MMKHRLDLEYRGTAYRGWQTQRNAPSVAAALQKACRGVFRDPEPVGGAGRTDAGVHALHQVAHLRSAGPVRPKGNLLLALNDLLPPDIAVTRVTRAADEFDARRDAVGRVYRYQILNRRSAFGADSTWWVRDRLDPRPMREAAALLTGRHDFAAFSELDTAKPRDTRLDLELADIEVQDGGLLLRFKARYFLWKMARRLTGYLVEVGRGRFKPGLTPAVFSQDRSVLAPFTAPPQGLFLERVIYPGDGSPPPGSGFVI